MVHILDAHHPTVLSAASYRSLPMAELFRRVADNRDAAALHELHENRIIVRTADGRNLLPAQYLISLFERNQPALGDHAQRAYDMTIDKFHHLPKGCKGVNCAKYFQACYRKFQELLDKHPGMDEAGKEALAASVLRNFMTRHFYLSVRESLRGSDPFVSRYFWHVNGGSLCLLFPKGVCGSIRRVWLESNVTDADPSRPGERRRVQTLIDRYFEKGRFVGEEYAEEQLASSRIPPVPRKKPGPELEPGLDLAETVAGEKASIAHTLRPAIRVLGPEKIRELVLRIFTDLELGEYSAERVAKNFGITEPALSRFAGTGWSAKPANGQERFRVPDLWMNLSGLLARNETFGELAKSAGVWDKTSWITNTERAGRKAP